MVFARLDVYWPDGRFDSYMLEGDTVSVGRAPGNTIPIESDTISRYHFSIIHQDDRVNITDLDSENGTFVDGVRLQSNTPFMLESVEEIQAGHLRIIYHPVDENPTLPVSPLTEDDTLRVEREDANFRLALDMPRMQVWPAASSSVELAITSTADETRRFGVNVEGVPQKWLRINRPELELNPNETGYVLINVKPPRRSDIVPESFEMLVQVEPLDNPMMVLEAPVQLDLQSYNGFGMALATPEIENDEPFRLYLHNQGSSPLNVAVSGHAINNSVPLIFNMPESELTLAPGQRLQVNGTVTGKRALSGSASTHAFDLRVKA
ncbi:MAG: FHA domain-containing protein, partial [Aggregatilineales bacterium]